jgi:hypothetical protein
MLTSFASLGSESGATESRPITRARPFPNATGVLLPCPGWLPRAYLVSPLHQRPQPQRGCANVTPGSSVMDMEVVSRSHTTTEPKVLPRRRVVERTFGWLRQCRCPVRDDERTIPSSAGWIHRPPLRIMPRCRA